MNFATAWCEAQLLDVWSSSVNTISGFNSPTVVVFGPIH